MVKLPRLNLASLQIIPMRHNGNVTKVTYLTRLIHRSVELYVIRDSRNLPPWSPSPPPRDEHARHKVARNLPSSTRDSFAI
jgi:hypothetical protein